MGWISGADDPQAAFLAKWLHEFNGTLLDF